MNRLMPLLAAVFVIGTTCWAGVQNEEPDPSFTALELRRFGKLEGKLDGTIRTISEGVDMKLVGRTADDNLDVQAKSVHFFYAEGDERAIDHIVFAGGVVFVHSEGVVRAEKVTLDFNTGKAEFTGNPRVDNDQIRGVEAAYITLDINTHDFVMGPGKIKEIILTSEEEDRG